MPVPKIEAINTGLYCPILSAIIPEKKKIPGSIKWSTSSQG
jgi:hypothetical protein